MAILKPTTTVTGIEDPRTAKQRAGFIESAFDLASQPIPIPVQGIAGFDPLETQARTLAGGLGGFQPFLNTGADMAQQGFDTLGLGRGTLAGAAQFFRPGAARAFYNPFDLIPPIASPKPLPKALSLSTSINLPREPPNAPERTALNLSPIPAMSDFSVKSLIVCCTTSSSKGL